MPPGRRLYQWVLIAVMAALVTACGRLWSRPVSETRGSGNLVLTLFVSKSLPYVGEPVKIRYTVKNPTDQTEVIQLEEKQEPVMDILIGFARGEGRTRLYWSDGREITPEMRRLELAPGESKTIEMTWVPDETAEGWIVTVLGILHREQRYTDVPIEICVGRCPIY